MQVLQRQRDFRRVEASTLLGELLRLAQVVEELAAGTVVENEVELVAGLEGVFHAHDERVVDLAQNVPLRLRVLDLVLLLDHRLVQHFHRVDFVLTHLLHLEHLPETALPDHFQNLKVVETHRRVVQLRVLASVVRIIAAPRTLRVKRVVVAQVRKIDLLNARWRTVRLNPHELLKRIHVLNVLILHYTMQPILQPDTNRIDPL